MEVNEQLVRAVTQAVVAQLMASGAQPQDVSSTPAPEGAGSFAGKTRMRPKHSYENAVRAQKGTDPKEIVIGVGAAFQTEITKTMSGIPLEEVLRNIKAGIEEEGMTSRVVKVLDTSDVGFMGLEARSFPDQESESACSPKEQPLFIRKICIRFPIWSFFHRLH